MHIREHTRMLDIHMYMRTSHLILSNKKDNNKKKILSIITISLYVTVFC